MKRITVAVLTALALSATTFAWSHSGGTNSQGCHYNHKTGGYHCH